RLLLVRPPKVHMRLREVRVHLETLSEFSDGPVVLTRIIKTSSHNGVDNEREWLQLAGLLPFRDGVGHSTYSFQVRAMATMRSRCVIPFWCAALTASANGIASASKCPRGMPPLTMRSLRGLPSTSSMVRKSTPLAASTEWMVTMLGWLSAAMVCASRSKRAG